MTYTHMSLDDLINEFNEVIQRPGREITRPLWDELGKRAKRKLERDKITEARLNLASDLNRQIRALKQEKQQLENANKSDEIKLIDQQIEHLYKNCGQIGMAFDWFPKRKSPFDSAIFANDFFNGLLQEEQNPGLYHFAMVAFRCANVFWPVDKLYDFVLNQDCVSSETKSAISVLGYSAKNFSYSAQSYLENLNESLKNAELKDLIKKEILGVNQWNEFIGNIKPLLMVIEK